MTLELQTQGILRLQFFRDWANRIVTIPHKYSACPIKIHKKQQDQVAEDLKLADLLHGLCGVPHMRIAPA